MAETYVDLMTIDATNFEQELKTLIRKYGFTNKSSVTDEILTLYLIACMRQYITNIHIKDQPCWCKEWINI